jgi:hypothetical protein
MDSGILTNSDGTVAAVTVQQRGPVHSRTVLRLLSQQGSSRVGWCAVAERRLDTDRHRDTATLGAETGRPVRTERPRPHDERAQVRDEPPREHQQHLDPSARPAGRRPGRPGGCGRKHHPSRHLRDHDHDDRGRRQELPRRQRRLPVPRRGGHGHAARRQGRHLRKVRMNTFRLRHALANTSR